MNASARLSFDDFVIDTAALELRCAGERTAATPQAVRALIVLARSSGELVTREQLYAELWPDPDVDVDRGLNTLIRQLRIALGDDATEPRFIRTYPRRGYRFLQPVTAQGQQPQVVAVIHDPDDDAATAGAVAPSAGSGIGIRFAAKRHMLAALAVIVLLAIVVSVRSAMVASESAASAQPALEETAVPPTARADYMAGRFLLAQSTIERRIAAVTHLEAAVDSAPDFAPAHAWLSSAYYWAGRYDDARIAADRALAIDPGQPRALMIKGTILLVRDLDWSTAAKLLKEAVRIAPGEADFHHGYAFALATAGRADDAIAEMRIALELEPVSSVVTGDLGLMYIYAGRFDEAARWCARAIELDPHADWAAECAFDALARLGRFDDAAAYIRSEPGSGSPGFRATGVGGSQQLVQQYRDWRARNASHRLDTGTGSAYGAALALVQAGRDADALAALERAAHERGPGFVTITVDPRFRSLWNQPRFAEIAAPLIAGDFADPRS